MSAVATVGLILLAFEGSSARALQPADELRNVKVGDRLPPFSVQGIDGKTYDLPAFKDRVFVIVFVRPDQKTSATALDILQRAVERSPEPRPSVLAVVSNHQAAEPARKLAHDRRLGFPLALDGDRKMYGDFGLIVTPTTLLIDASGVLRFELPHVPPEFERRVTMHLELLLGRITPAEHEELLKQTEAGSSARNDPYHSQLSLAQSLLDRRSYEEAIAVLVKLKSQKETPQVLILLGRASLALGRLEEAAGYLEPLKEVQPLPPAGLFALGQLESRRGNDESAESFLTAALRGYPQKAPVLFELGRIHERRGQCDKAMECYRQALEEVFSTP